MKLIDAKKDHYRRLAHEQGYRSRASYKLKEINKSYRIIGPGSYVLDLGCAPGGWSQVAHQIAGNQGKVLGIDLSFVEELPGVEIIRGDIEDPDILEQIMSFFNRKVDSVICDLSPNVSGNWSVDHAVQISLNYTAEKLMEKILSNKGNALFRSPKSLDSGCRGSHHHEYSLDNEIFADKTLKDLAHPVQQQILLNFRTSL